MVVTAIPERVSDSLQRYLVQASEAGMPRDQVERFLRYEYVAFPAMMRFHAAARACDRQGGPVAVAIGGTRGPGKTHASMAQVALDDCQRAPGLKFLFLRRVQRSAAESLEDLTARVLRQCPHQYASSTGKIEFSNGSRILMGGFHSDADIDRYLGLEYDGICIEEATRLTQARIDQLRGSVRTSRSDWRPRVYMTTNPDGVGLGWFKRLFIQPWREGRETWTRFIEAHYRDNPFLNREYIDYLDSLTGRLRRAWRDADWDAFEGQAFATWQYDLHVVSPFAIPDNWLRWRAVDEGYANPWCCLWLAQDPQTRRRYVYREAYATQLTAQQQAERILAMTGQDEIIYATYADPAMWGRKNALGMVTTTAQEYAAVGVPLTRADNDRLQGKRRVDSALALQPDGLPGLQVFSTCYNLIRTLPLLVLDDINPEDVDTDGEDHAYDALRYGLSNVRVMTLDDERRRRDRRAESDLLQRIWEAF